jgi:hypothetical protein
MNKTKKVRTKKLSTTKSSELFGNLPADVDRVDNDLIDAALDYYKKDIVDAQGEGVSSDAVVLDDKGNAILDENNLPQFHDSMEWPTHNAQILAIWTCCKALLEQGLVPHTEAEGVFGLMERVAKLQRKGRDTLNFDAELPINYFVGMVHVINMAREFQLLGAKAQTSLDMLATDLALRVDSYRSIKAKEATMEKAPDVVNSKEVAVKSDGSYF